MLEITTAASLEQLAQCCATMLQDIPDDPFASEWIASPNPGMRRWLELQLAKTLGASDTAQGDGIVANITFANLFGLRQALLAAEPAADAWSMNNLVWALCTLGSHRPNPGTPGESLTAWARRVADMFIRYDRYRPDMIRSWAAGSNNGPDGKPLTQEDRWQPELFCKLRDLLNSPAPSEVLPALIERLRDEKHTIDLPDRLAFFGFHLPNATDGFFELTHAVATHRTVHLYFLDPAPVTATDQWAPIARSWGARSEDLHERVASQVTTPDCTFAALKPVTAAPIGTVLGQFQQSILSPIANGTVSAIGPDQSVQIHGAQGALRQVEVLRDALCGLLADNTDLREDDIVVVCGNLDRFVPLIHGVFGTAAFDEPDRTNFGAPRLRYQIDGTEVGQTNPVAAAAARALELATGRFSALDVIEFIQMEAVQRRFGFDGQAIEQIRQWITELDVRWGLDVYQRERVGVPESIVAGTWQRALDRLCLGLAHARDDLLIGDFVPYGVEGGQLATLGSLADLIRRLKALANQAITPMSISARLRLLEHALRDLVAAPSDASWQFDVITRMCAIDTVTEQWLDRVETTLSEVRPELCHTLEGGGRRSNTFRGGITFTTMNGLEAVPFKVTCLLGFDDQVAQFASQSADDLISRSARLGDPDRRGEATDALLATLCSTSKYLLVFHDDRSPITNEEIHDASLLADLRDAIDAIGCSTAGLRVSHPRHASDPANFTSELRRSFDVAALDGAKARRGELLQPTRLQETLNVQPPLTDEIGLGDLLSFYKDPPKAVSRQVLGLRFPENNSEQQGSLRIDLSPLEKYAVREIVLRAFREKEGDVGTTDGSDHQVRHHQAELIFAGDHLPVGSLGIAEFDSVAAEAQQISAAAAAAMHGTEAEIISVRIPIGSGRFIVGDVSCVATQDGYQIIDIGAGKMKMGDRLRIWIQTLALIATHPNTRFEAALVRLPNREPKLDGTFILAPPTDTSDAAREALIDLAALFDRAQVEPILLFPEVFASNDSPPFITKYDEKQVARFEKIWDKERRYKPQLTALFGDHAISDLLNATDSTTDLGAIESILTMINEHFVATMQGSAS